eukprot:763702-Hanusia_phi.AAC.3
MEYAGQEKVSLALHTCTDKEERRELEEEMLQLHKRHELQRMGRRIRGCTDEEEKKRLKSGYATVGKE